MDSGLSVVTRGPWSPGCRYRAIFQTGSQEPSTARVEDSNCERQWSLGRTSEPGSPSVRGRTITTLSCLPIVVRPAPRLGLEALLWLSRKIGFHVGHYPHTSARLQERVFHSFNSDL